MKYKDILIAARPDQSLQIYSSLLRYGKLKFNFITFKVLPLWMSKFIKHKKIRFVGNYASICIWGTIKHLAIHKFKIFSPTRFKDDSILDFKLNVALSKTNFKVVHFWPENGGRNIMNYSNSKDSFIIADVHMPHPKVVFNELSAVYEKFGIEPTKTHLYSQTLYDSNYIENVKNVLVPSKYVADTYREIYPDRNYFCVPYGINLSDNYQKKYKNEIRNFIYCGRISLEKGCDVLLDYFAKHKSFTLHVCGTIVTEQEFIFDKYKACSNIVFHGQLAKKDLLNEIKKADVGIHLSRFDAYSLAVGEIIGCGKPVIISNKTGNSDDVISFKLGYVTSLDDKSIAESVAQITNSDNYNDLIDSIDQYISGPYSAYGDRMISFYEAAINKSAQQYLV